MIATISRDCFSQLRKFEPKQQRCAVVQSFCYLVTKSLVHVIKGLKGKHSCVDPEGGGGQGVWTPPLKNHKNLGFLSNTGPDPQKKHKASKPAFNVGPKSTRPR